MLIHKDIANKIISTKKYQRLSVDVIQAAVVEASNRYTNPTEIDRKARNILHQIWGAYYYNPPNFKKSYDQLLQSQREGQNIQAALLPILNLHSSTRERLPILTEFYAQIFKITGPVESILDHACGLNPLTIPWMNLPPNCTYTAYDIDIKETTFLSSIFTHVLQMPQVKIGQKSILESSQEPTDVAFFLKCITCLDHLQKNIGIQALEQQQCRYAVVSFAIKSIKGYEKGMKDFYGLKFEEFLKQKQWQYEKLMFTTEMVYIIRKA